MNSNLRCLILAYQSAVCEVLALMQGSGIKQPITNIEWACMDIPQLSKLIGGIPYFKHGFGCKLKLPRGAVDFDFGEQGQINGFDLWRLLDFAGSRLFEYGFSSEAALKQRFEDEVKAGRLVYSGYILYYLVDSSN